MNEVDILNLIHTDLGYIICFLVFFVLVILLKYIYKFFDMIFHFWPLIIFYKRERSDVLC